MPPLINHIINKINLEVNCCGKWHISCVLLPYTFMLSILYLSIYTQVPVTYPKLEIYFPVLILAFFLSSIFCCCSLQSTQHSPHSSTAVYMCTVHMRFLHTFTPSTSSNHATQSTVDPVRARPNFHSQPTQDTRLLVWHLSRTNEVVLLSIPSTIASHARPAS